MLEQILQEKDLSYAWLARRIGVDRSTVAYWVRKKKKPLAKHYPAIAKALGLTEQQVKEMFA